MLSLKHLPSLVFLLCTVSAAKLCAQANKQNRTNTVFLKENASSLQQIERGNRSRAFLLAAQKGWETFGITKEGKVFTLHGVDDFGLPLYKITENNTVAAATINTNKLYIGGALGLNLSGATIPSEKVAIWDGGAVLTTHTEFAPNRVEIRDGNTSSSAHATHVAGTIMAQGKNPNARGMAYGLPKLLSFDFTNDNSEMSGYAASLLLSNHSYGTLAGWYENTSVTPTRWEFRGRAGANEDYKFGYYDSDAKEWDRICYNAPYYLPVKSAGNYRNSNGPEIGTTYYRYNANGVLVNAGPRPAGISSNDGYDILGTYAVAKNIMTVAAVNPLPYRTVDPSDVTISSFSAWGPTDDGRIKPDISADGVNVTSTSNAFGGQSYTTYSGTSMATPSITGSLVLLQELYHQKNNAFMRAATLKALALGTASEAGSNPGPDYIFGWGLMNTESAARAILNKDTKSLIEEKVLNQGDTETFSVVASGDGPVIATLSWTDPEIEVIPEANALNNPTLRLVNDLDMKASDGSLFFLPWVLNPANPAAAATKGDNFRDNVEQVYIADAIPGKTYTFTISHKGLLKSGAQAYSVVVTGVGGKPYCTAMPSSSNDAKITSFNLANVNYIAPAGCTSYTDLTNQTILLEKAKTYPLVVSIGTCNFNANKIAKVFVDWNNDGDFEDSDELVAASQVTSGNGQFAANITVPTTVNIDNFSLLRVVLSETSDANTVQPCGNYSKGETLDYRVKFLAPSADVGITKINDPLTSCASSQQTVTVVIRNFGTQPIANIPITASISEGNTNIANLVGTFSGEIKPAQEREFTLPGFYQAQPGKTYQITAQTTLSIDPIAGNNQKSKTEQISLAPMITNQSAFYCNDINQYQLAANGDGVTYWYKDATSITPFAFGNSAITTTSPTDGYYAGLNQYTSSAGPKTKYETGLGSGTYLQTTSSVSVNVAAPVILESARLYIGHAGTIRFYVKDSNGIEVANSTINVTATRSTPASGTATDDPKDQGQVYRLNLKFPISGNYTIHTVYEDGATIFRNNNVTTNIYPASSSLNVFSITGNDATQPNSFYYYFYDLKISALGCSATSRIQVPVTNIIINKNGEELSSNIASGNQWYVNGEKIEGAVGQQYKPLKAGKYQVWAQINANCTSISEDFPYLPERKNDHEIKLSVFPIPTLQDLTVAFETPEKQQVKISIFNPIGQKVMEIDKGLQNGIVIENLNIYHLPKGTYVLHIRVNDKVYTKKIIKI